MSFLRTTSLVSVILLSIASSLPAEAAQKKEKAPTFAVLQIGENTQVIRSDEVSAKKKEISANHKAAVQAHKEAKKAAKAAKEKFSEPAPKKPSFKVLKDKFKTEEEAKAYIAAKNEKTPKKGSKKGKGGGGSS